MPIHTPSKAHDDGARPTPQPKDRIEQKIPYITLFHFFSRFVFFCIFGVFFCLFLHVGPACTAMCLFLSFFVFICLFLSLFDCIRPPQKKSSGFPPADLCPRRRPRPWQETGPDNTQQRRQGPITPLRFIKYERLAERLAEPSWSLFRAWQNNCIYFFACGF